jgi:hypothetical protein
VSEDDKQPAAERLLKAREAVAKEFNLADDDWRVKRLALLMCVHSQAEDMVANGRSVDINGLLSLDESIQKIRESIKKTEPMSVNVTFTEGVRGIYNCHHCGKKNELKEGEYTPPSRPKAPPQTSDAPAANAPLPDATAAPADSAAPAARPMPKANKVAALDTRPASHQTATVTPLVTYRDDVSGSKFHSAVINGREVPPLKRLQPDHWRTTDQAQAPHPYVGREVAHPLPPVPRTDAR